MNNKNNSFCFGGIMSTIKQEVESVKMEIDNKFLTIVAIVFLFFSVKSARISALLSVDPSSTNIISRKLIRKPPLSLPSIFCTLNDSLPHRGRSSF